nr:hypothetical protein CFP56_33919 [Quercus suber]
MTSIKPETGLVEFIREDDDDDEVGGSSEEDELELVKRVLSGEERGRGGGDCLQIGGPTRALRSGFQAVRPGFLLSFRLDRTSSR